MMDRSKQGSLSGLPDVYCLAVTLSTHFITQSSYHNIMIARQKIQLPMGIVYTHAFTCWYGHSNLFSCLMDFPTAFFPHGKYFFIYFLSILFLILFFILLFFFWIQPIIVTASTFLKSQSSKLRALGACMVRGLLACSISLSTWSLPLEWPVAACFQLWM